MRNFFTALKIGLQILKCLNCSHKLDCPYSVITPFRGKNYKVVVLPIDEKESK